jgi:hypothetical protein
MSQLKVMNYRGWETLVSKELCVAPYFSSTLRYRIRHKLPCNIVVVGEPGIGKSYLATDIARVHEGCKRSGDDRFAVEQIVYMYSQYMDLILKLRMGKAIVFDEPSYAMGKRDWYKDLNKALVQTMESQRFLIHPVFIPVINQALLDKIIRSYLIQFQVHVIGRGHAVAYRLKASQSQEKVYRYELCHLHYRLFDGLCVRNRESCLGCKELNTCNVFRARYERNKRDVQFTRYEQAKETATKKESKDLTETQIVEIALPYVKDCLTSKGTIDVQALRIALQDHEGIYLSTWKTYNIKKQIELRHEDKLG